IHEVAGELMGQLHSINGTIPVLIPQPVLDISTGATTRLQGEYAYSISGIDPQQVYGAAQQLMGRMYQQMGTLFSSVVPDLYIHTPNLQIDILRDEASSYGVSASRIEELLR